MSDIDSKAVWPGWNTVRLIGRGSFGAVYEIQREVFGKVEKAALKIISIPQHSSDINSLRNDGFDDETITERYAEHLQQIVNEYSLMVSLKGHPNAVYCDDIKYVQHEDGIGWDIFIKMELLTALDETLRKTEELAEDEVVKIGENISSILAFCGQRNIIHRDIKPENIFVSDAGAYKLGDFGIAKTVERTTGGTKTGTYRYMAPEVYNNKPYGTKADIYSLGLTLYWLLNERRLPFMPMPPALPSASEEEEARRRRFDGEPLPPPAHGCEELKAIVLKACAFDPADRYQSAAEMEADLKALQEKHLAGLIPLPLPQRRSAKTAAAGNTTGSFGTATNIGQGTAAELTTGPFSKSKAEVEQTAAAKAEQDNGTVSLFGEERRRKAEEEAAAAALAAAAARKKAAEEAARKAEEAARAAEAAKKAAQAAEAPEKKKSKIVPILVGLAAIAALLVFLLLPKNVKMPDLVNMPKASAEDKLGSVGLKNYELLYEKSESIAKGNVIKTDPAADTELSKKDKVTVTISAGDGKTDVPDLSGKTKEQAEKLLSDAKLKAEFEETFNNKIAAGSVVAQEPASGSRIDEDSTVSVSISKGPAPINAYTLRFNANGGSVSEASRKVNEGSGYGTLPTPRRDYYNFQGWYTAASGGTKVSSSTKMGASNITLYAHWTQKAASGWVLKSEAPSGAKITETKYSYTLREYTTSSSSSLSGWTKSGTTTAYGAEQGPVYSDPSGNGRKVRSEQYVKSTTTKYKYYHRYGTGYDVATGKTGTIWGSDGSFGSGARHNITLTSQLTVYSSNWVGIGVAAYKSYKCPTCGATQPWFADGTTKTNNYATRWYYQDPVYTYSFYRDVQKETTSDPTGKANVSNVKTYVKYIPK